jgi:hypothetical protein
LKVQQTNKHAQIVCPPGGSILGVAIADYNKAIEFAPQILLAHLHYSSGITYYNKKDYDRASGCTVRPARGPRHPREVYGVCYVEAPDAAVTNGTTMPLHANAAAKLSVVGGPADPLGGSAQRARQKTEAGRHN